MIVVNYIQIDNFVVKCRAYPSKEQQLKIDRILQGIRIAHNVTCYEILQIRFVRTYELGNHPAHPPGPIRFMRTCELGTFAVSQEAVPFGFNPCGRANWDAIATPTYYSVSDSTHMDARIGILFRFNSRKRMDLETCASGLKDNAGKK